MKWGVESGAVPAFKLVMEGNPFRLMVRTERIGRFLSEKLCFGAENEWIGMGFEVK